MFYHLLFRVVFFIIIAIAYDLNEYQISTAKTVFICELIFYIYSFEYILEKKTKEVVYD